MMAMRNLGTKTASALLVALQLVGCAHTAPEQTTEEQQVSGVLDKLSTYASAAVNAQRELAMTADAKVQNAAVRRQRMLSDMVSYDFYGDVETIVSDIANKYGYKFEVYGKRPAEHVVTNVYVQNKPVIDILKYIGYTSTKFLDISVKPDVIELHYKG